MRTDLPQVVIAIHLRVGGSWRYVLVANGGFEVAFHGELREIVPNERIVCIDVFEGMPDGEALTTRTFTETDGRTTLTQLVEHSCQEHRDAHINSGMETGMQEAMDHLWQVAISLRARLRGQIRQLSPEPLCIVVRARDTQSS